MRREVGERRAKAGPGLRRALQMVFQDPYSALNPRIRVKTAMAEPIAFYRLAATQAEAEEDAAEEVVRGRRAGAAAEARHAQEVRRVRRAYNTDMPLTRRRLLHLGLGAAGATAGFGAPSEPALKPDRVHQELVDGNRRFLTGHSRHPHSSLAWAKRTGRLGQHPHALVLCCSDSRVSPEILFDQGIGDLFTIRVAGNAGNEDEIASIEYAVEHLHVPVCVVLGHSSCGAVTAVVKGDKLPIEIQHLVAHIGEAFEVVKARKAGLDEKALIDATVEANVFQAMHDLVRNGPIIREHLHRGRVKLVGAIYHIDTGTVSWLGPHPQEAQLVAHAG